MRHGTRVTGLIVVTFVCALLGPATQPASAQATSAPAEADGAPIVFYRTIGNGSDRLYRRVLDGAHLPELLAERPASYVPDDPGGAWWVSPDGSLALRLGRLPDAVEGDWPYEALEAIPLRAGAPTWRLGGRFLEPTVTAWSPDGRWVSDGRSLTDVTAGTTRDVEGPEDSAFLGFTADGEALLYQSGDTDEDRSVLWRLDPGDGIPREVPWGSVRSTGATWPTGSSTLLSQAAISSWRGSVPRPALRDLRTGVETTPPGMADGASAVGFDPTGRTAIFEMQARRYIGFPPRQKTVIYGVADGVTTTLWRGPGGYREEWILSPDGRYLLFPPHFADTSFELVSLDGSGSVTIPISGDVTSATPLRVIPGSLPPSDSLGLPVPVPTPPGEVIDGAPSVLLTTMESARDGSHVARVRIVSPATTGTVVRAETTVPMPAHGDTELMDASAVPRPGHRDVLILVGRWDRPWLYRWRPGGDLRRVPSLGGSKAVFGPIWSPDGRHLAFRAGMSGRRFKVVDAALRLERTISLPSRWTNAGLVGWTTDSRRLVFEPPRIVYADEVPEDRPACENQMPVGTVALATGRLVPRRGTRELSVRLQTDLARRGATGEWVQLDVYRRSFTFEHGCPIRSSRSEIEVRGGQVWDTRWSPNGTALHVLVGRGPDARVLTYRRPWADPRQRPRVAEPIDVVVEIGPAAPGGRWVAIRGEGRLDGRNAGLLDLRSGDVHWIDEPGRIQSWIDAVD